MASTVSIRAECMIARPAPVRLCKIQDLTLLVCCYFCRCSRFCSHSVTSVETISFLLPHDQTDLYGDAAFQYLEKHIRSIEEIQAVTGLKFFPKAAQERPNSVAATEKARASGLRPFTGKRPNSLANSPQCKTTAGADR